MPFISPPRFNVVRWSIFIILILTYMLAFFHRMAPAVISSNLMKAFNTSGAQLGSLAAMYFYIYTAMQIPAGVLADTLGARIAISAGSLMAGAGSILFGLATTFSGVSAGRALVGLGVSVVFVGLFKSNSLWFRDRNFGLISGLTLLFGNIGAIASAGPLALILKSCSWRSVFLVLGGATIGLALLTALFVRNRPEDLGFPSLREMEGKSSHPVRQQHWWKDLTSVVRTGATWPVLWVDLGMVGSMLAFVGLWAIPFLRDVHGLGRSDAAVYTTTALAGFAVGSLLFGLISDRLGHRKPVIMAGTLLYTAACLGLAYAPWTPGLFGQALFALLGFGCGGFIVTFANAKEVVAPALSGMAVGLVNTGLFLGAAVMQPLFGWAMDLGWDGRTVNGLRVYSPADYHSGFLFMLAFAAIGVIGATRIRETHCRNITIAQSD
ncbi:MAG: MFS transporter [Desulfuromonadales bacterium]|nr:MFS transporter [Desulfuromonadales bacterium]